MKTYEKLYDYLKNKNDYISGEEIAKQFNISRSAVWKAIKTLETKGISFHSVKNKGYLLISGDLIRVKNIENKLKIPVIMTEYSKSTQQDAKLSNQPTFSQPRLYLANQQEQAIGRFDRTFFAQENKGIYMTLHLKPNLPLSQLPAYTISVAASIVKAIYHLTNIKTHIKWVNDIYIGSKKIAGILTEAITSVETGFVTDIFIGVGINFNIIDFPDELKAKATSLFLDKPTISREDLICEIWGYFFNFSHEDLFKIYKDASFILEKEITFTQNSTLITAKAVDLTPEGHLVIEQNGELTTLSSGEISLSSWN